MKDTILSLIFTRSNLHEIRIAGTPGETVQHAIAADMESIFDIDEAIGIIEDDYNERVLCYDEKGTEVDSSAEVSSIKTAKPMPAMRLQTTTQII